MQIIQDICSSPKDQRKPYQPPLKAILATQSEIITYKKDNVDKRMMYIGLCDKSGHTKATLYDPTKVANVTNGTTIVIKNHIVRPDGTIVLTPQSKVFKTSPIEVDNAIIERAIESVRPATPPPMPIPEIKKSPEKTMTSIQGVISQDEIPRHVTVRGEQVPVRNLTIAKDSSSMKVSLWRKDASMPYQSGDTVSITNVVVKSYQGEKQLSSTTRTTVQKSEIPPEDITDEIIAYVEEEGHIELLAASNRQINIKQDILQQALDGDDEDWQTVLDTLLPFNATITIKDGEAVAFSIANIS